MKPFKSIVHNKGLLHIETPLGIVNIYADLTDMHGRRVNTVTFRPNDYAGEPKVVLRGSRFVELKQINKGYQP